MNPKLIDRIHAAMAEAKSENGKVEIIFDVDRLYLRVFGKSQRSSSTAEGFKDLSEFFIRSEHTEYL
jgi:hypothetical protein